MPKARGKNGVNVSRERNVEKTGEICTLVLSGKMGAL